MILTEGTLLILDCMATTDDVNVEIKIKYLREDINHRTLRGYFLIVPLAGREKKAEVQYHNSWSV